MGNNRGIREGRVCEGTHTGSVKLKERGNSVKLEESVGLRGVGGVNQYRTIFTLFNYASTIKIESNTCTQRFT